MMFGPQSSFFAELFSTRVRYSGASLGFQLGSVIAGGFTPLIAAYLAAQTGNLVLAGAFCVGLGLISLACIGLAARRKSVEASERVAQPIMGGPLSESSSAS
jgi:hypothetical protein